MLVVVTIGDYLCSVSLVVFSQSSCEVSASLTDVGFMAVRAIDLIHC